MASIKVFSNLIKGICPGDINVSKFMGVLLIKIGKEIMLSIK